MRKIFYDFKHVCINCGQRPTIDKTGLCGPCCFGEAESMYDWLWDNIDWTNNKRAARHALWMLDDAAKCGLTYSKEIENRLFEIMKQGDPKLYEENVEEVVIDGK